MAGSMKDIKLRIKSVESTMQITKAMELVASSKMRRAKERVEHSRPYFETLYKTLTEIAAADPRARNPYLRRSEIKRTLLVVWALAHLGDLQRDELLHILGRETTDAIALARAVELIDASGAVDYVRGYARELVADAKAHLVGARLEETPRDVLLSMADFFVERAG